MTAGRGIITELDRKLIALAYAEDKQWLYCFNCCMSGLHVRVEGQEGRAGWLCPNCGFVRSWAGGEEDLATLKAEDYDVVLARGGEMNIDKMPAGEEMNKLIATEVMGWRWDDDWGCLVPPEQVAKPSEMWTDWQEGIDEDGSTYWYWEPVPGTMVSGVAYNGDASKVILPDFSGDDGQALKVAKKVMNDDFRNHFRIGKAGPEFEDEPLFGRYFANIEIPVGVLCYADTLALAICRAAYKVVTLPRR